MPIYKDIFSVKRAVKGQTCSARRECCVIHETEYNNIKMSVTNDDPREILALLNSLGFIGITAPQLKAFIKDLKVYRKVKEREKQRRKEEIKTKIVNKQKSMIKEIVNECCKEQYSPNEIVQSNSSSLDDSLVRIRIQHIPQTETCHCSKENLPIGDEARSSRVKMEKTSRMQISKSEERSHSRDRIRCSPNVKASMPKESRLTSESLDANVRLKGSNRKESIENRLNNKSAQPTALLDQRPMSAPNLSQHIISKPKSTASESIGSTRRSVSTSRISTRSDHKSFIRPWRLQSENQRTHTRKNDPVLLYQKYQQEWKQISFPGEAKHNSVRWAVREKMLGTDPRPLPLPKKSASMPALRRK